MSIRDYLWFSVVLLLGFFLIVMLEVFEIQQKRTIIQVEYEDGSGVLSDGRMFCIKGELCEVK